MIANLTQHPATTEQIEAGCFDLPTEVRQQLAKLLTFDLLPTSCDVEERAGYIVSLLDKQGGNVTAAMIGGAPYLMGPLEAALKKWGIRPLYAFSLRESVETTGPDGGIVKTNVFRHIGFVEA